MRASFAGRKDWGAIGLTRAASAFQQRNQCSGLLYGVRARSQRNNGGNSTGSRGTRSVTSHLPLRWASAESLCHAETRPVGSKRARTRTGRGRLLTGSLCRPRHGTLPWQAAPLLSFNCPGCLLLLCLPPDPLGQVKEAAWHNRPLIPAASGCWKSREPASCTWPGSARSSPARPARPRSSSRASSPMACWKSASQARQRRAWSWWK